MCKLIVILIQKEFTDLECSVSFLIFPQVPLEFIAKPVYFIAIIEIISLMKEHCKAVSGYSVKRRKICCLKYISQQFPVAKPEVYLHAYASK